MWYIRAYESGTSYMSVLHGAYECGTSVHMGVVLQRVNMRVLHDAYECGTPHMSGIHRAI